MRAYLHNILPPYNLRDPAKAIIDSLTLSRAFKFFNASSSTYYISIKHRNTIETLSRTGGETFNAGTVMGYDFTSAVSKAFRNNMKQVDTSPVKFAIYSGDVNQDGVVDATDLQRVDNHAFNFVTGYVATDLTGDNVVDATDAAIADNNAFNFVSKITP